MATYSRPAARAAASMAPPGTWSSASSSGRLLTTNVIPRACASATSASPICGLAQNDGVTSRKSLMRPAPLAPGHVTPRPPVALDHVEQLHANRKAHRSVDIALGHMEAKAVGDEHQPD